ncbi:MAG: carboxypeptidase-like regulatory domain-containing protein [Gemmatimonadaceae bacterium]
MRHAPLLLATIVLAACDPCAGVVACGSDGTTRLTGRVVNYPARDGVVGVRISVTPVAGVPVSTTTDADGHWTVALPSPAENDGRVSVSVVAPGAAYTVPNINVRTGGPRGEATSVGRWFATPYVRFVGQLVARPGINLSGATVTAVRTGGVEGAPLPVRAQVSTGHQFYIDAPAIGLGSMEFRITIEGPNLPRPFVREGLGFAPQFADSPLPGVQGVFNIGSALDYVARLERRGVDGPLPGVPATFRRTGGIRTLRDSIVSVSTVDGLISLDLRPLEEGEVIGDLILRPAAPLPLQVITGVRLQTQDDDLLRLALVVRLGAQVRSAIRLFERTSFAPLAGVQVEYRPTSGPLTTTIAGVTDANGQFGIVAPVDGEGLVLGDLVVFHLAPRAPEVFPGIEVTAAADDSVRLAALLGVGPSLLYVGSIEDADTFLPITDGTAEFRRTGGIAVRDTLYTWPIGADGSFRIAPTPLEDGEVIGTLTFRLAAPYADTTFTDVRLTTFTDDGIRSAGVYRVRKP